MSLEATMPMALLVVIMAIKIRSLEDVVAELVERRVHVERLLALAENNNNDNNNNNNNNNEPEGEPENNNNDRITARLEERIASLELKMDFDFEPRLELLEEKMEVEEANRRRGDEELEARALNLIDTLNGEDNGNSEDGGTPTTMTSLDGEGNDTN